MVLKAGVWYLVARVADADAHPLRVYRVSRILELEALDERFERPADFDAGRLLGAWSERYQANLYRGEARVRLSPHGGVMLPYLLRRARSPRGARQRWPARRARLDHDHAADRIDPARPRRLPEARGRPGSAGTARVARPRAREALALTKLYGEQEDTCVPRVGADQCDASYRVGDLGAA